MNVGSESRQPGSPGEEYVPVDYRPKRLTTPLAAARRILFGTDPDRLYLNYRLREYMTILHSTELEEYVRALDKRITYWPTKDKSLLTGNFINIVTQVSGTPGATCTVVGEDVANHRLGRAVQRWQLEVTGGTTVKITRLTTPLSEEIASFVVVGGLSGLIQLTGSPLRVRLSNPAAQVGTVWHIEARARPAIGPDAVLNNLRTGLGEPALIEIFGLTPVEPYATFRNLWSSHPLLAYKLGGMLLALIYRINDIKQVE